MRKMIWVSDELVEEIKREAEIRDQSFSAYLVGLHRERMGSVTRGDEFEWRDAKTHKIVNRGSSGFFNPQPKDKGRKKK